MFNEKMEGFLKHFSQLLEDWEDETDYDVEFEINFYPEYNHLGELQRDVGIYVSLIENYRGGFSVIDEVNLGFSFDNKKLKDFISNKKGVNNA